MPILYRASFGYLIRHPWQLGLAVLGICIGVAVMVAVDLANQSSRQAFILSMDTLNGETTHQIVAGPAGVDESYYIDLRVDRGIRQIAPIVAGYVRARDRTLQVLGVDVFAERELRNFTSPSLGNVSTPGASAPGHAEPPADGVRHFLTGQGGVLMSAATAAEFGLATGDPFEVRANGKNYQATLVGVFGGEDQERLQNIVVTDIGIAQHWLEMTGRLSRIDVKIESGNVALKNTLEESLPAGVQLLSASGRTQSTAEMSDAFMTNLTAMSLLALLVGIFLIYNSVAFAVLQRRNLIGVLRALGLTRQETLRLILVEATVIGVIGAALGLFTGMWLGERLLILVARTVSDHYFVVNVTDVAVSNITIAKGLIAGIGATLVAAVVPAMEASSYQPTLALTRSTLEKRSTQLVPLMGTAGIVLLILSVILLQVPGSNLVVGLGALFILILGFSFCIPFFVRVVSRLFAPLAGSIGGTAARLAIGGVGQTLSRTGVAIVALAIAVSATIGVSIMVESFRGSVSEWLNNTLQSDVYVGVPGGALDPALVEDLVAVPGIDSYSTSRRVWIDTATGRTRIIALEMAPGSYAGTHLREADAEVVWHQFDNESAVLVSDSYAFRHDVARGDAVTLNTKQGGARLEIASVYQSYDSDNGAILMSRKTYDEHFDDRRVNSMGVYLRDGVQADSIMDEFNRISAGRQELLMSSNARIREISLGIFDRTFVITNVLYWLAVGVAVIGILGAMLALQLERAREFGVLRAIGMTPGQTGTLVAVQTGFIGFVAGAAALPLGIVMAWVLVEVINRRAFGWQIDMAISVESLIAAMLLAIGAAAIAGIYPAWRAARTPPAMAMRDE